MDTERSVTIEASALAFPPCGVREFVSRLGEAIGRRAAADRTALGIAYRFIVPPGMDGRFGDDVDYLPTAGWRRFCLSAALRRPTGLFHATHQYCSFKSLPGARHTLLTIHDVNFEHTKSGSRLARARRRFADRTARADNFAFISRFALDDTCRRFRLDGAKRVVYNGVTDLTGAPAHRPESLPADIETGSGFLFHLSGLDPHKNVGAMLGMMERLPRRRLVIAGNWAACPDMRRRAGAMPNVIPLGRVTDEERAWLFANCTAFVFPSLCEGFGLPPVEAMKLGKPVFLSRLTSLPEVGGDAAFYFTGFDPVEMAATVDRALAAPAPADALRAHAARFTWERCAGAYVDYYLDILNSRP